MTLLDNFIASLYNNVQELHSNYYRENYKWNGSGGQCSAQVCAGGKSHTTDDWRKLDMDNCETRFISRIPVAGSGTPLDMHSPHVVESGPVHTRSPQVQISHLHQLHHAKTNPHAESKDKNC